MDARQSEHGVRPASDCVVEHAGRVHLVLGPHLLRAYASNPMLRGERCKRRQCLVTLLDAQDTAGREAAAGRLLAW